MATGIKGSKTLDISTGDANSRYIIFSYEQVNMNPTSKTSDIKWSLKFKTNTTGRFSTAESGPVWVKINGTKVKENTSKNISYNVSNNSEYTIYSDTTTVKHNSDGTGTFSFEYSVALNLNGYYSNGSLIARTDSGSYTLTALSLGSAIYTVSPTNLTMGNDVSVKWKPENDSYYYRIRYELGSEYFATDFYSVSGKDSSGYMTKTNPVNYSRWAKALPDSLSGTMKIYLYTYTSNNNSSFIGKSEAKEITVSMSASATEIKPTVSLSITDAAGYGAYLASMSKVKATTTATPKEGATITGYSVTIKDGSTVLQSRSGNPATFGTIAYSSSWSGTSKSLTVAVTVTDSRNVTNTASTTFSLVKYSAPTFNKTYLGRCTSNGTEDDQGAYMKITGSISRTYMSGKTFTASIEYKTKSTNWTSWPTNSYSTTGSTNPISVGTSSSYNIYAPIKSIGTNDDYQVRITLNDNVSPARTVIATITATYALMEFYKDGTGISFGKMATKSNTMDIGMKVESTYNGVAYQILRDNYNIGIGISGNEAYRGIYDRGSDSTYNKNGMGAWILHWDTQNKLNVRGEDFHYTYHNGGGTAISGKMAYIPGDTINYGTHVDFAGHYGNKTALGFFIPVNAPILTNNVTVSGKVQIYGPTGTIGDPINLGSYSTTTTPKMQVIIEPAPVSDTSSTYGHGGTGIFILFTSLPTSYQPSTGNIGVTVSTNLGSGQTSTGITLSFSRAEGVVYQSATNELLIYEVSDNITISQSGGELSING